MDIGLNFTIYDFVVVGILLFFLARGIWVGFLRQMTGLVALYFGYFAASRYHDRLFPFLRDISDNQTVVFLITYFVLFIATFLIVMLLGKILQYGVQITFTQLFDKFLGGVVGLAQGIICVVIIHLVLGTLLAPESQTLRTCVTCSTVDEVAEFSRRVISDPELREALKQQAPAISLEEVQQYLDKTAKEVETTAPEQEPPKENTESNLPAQ